MPWGNSFDFEDIEKSAKTVSKIIFFNLFAAFLNLFTLRFNLFAAFLNLFPTFFNLSEAFPSLFVSIFSLSAVFFNLFAALFSLFVSLFSETTRRMTPISSGTGHSVLLISGI